MKTVFFIMTIFTEHGHGYMYSQACHSQKEIMAAKQQIQKFSKAELDLIGTHIISDSQITDLKTLTKIDPYFTKFTSVDSLADFTKHFPQAKQHLKSIKQHLKEIDINA